MSIEFLGDSTRYLSSAMLMTLLGLLSVAVWYDLKCQRIPNALILTGLLIGVMGNGLLPPGFGFNSEILPGGLGWWFAFKGIGYGFLMLLPFYLLRAMGAGDVKLVAMAGAFIGPGSVIGAVVFTFLAGGLMAITIVLKRKLIGQLLQNLKQMIFGSLVSVSTGRLPALEQVTASVGKLPYAAAIATGTISWLVWERITT